MANLSDIRNRIESIQNTQQITKAMKMVAAAKLRKAQNRIIETRPYASKMQEVVARLVKSASDENVLLQERENVENVLFIVIGSDRGLCGGFNNNLFKKVKSRIEADFASHRKENKLSILAVGRKATKHFGKRDYQIAQDFPGFFDELAFSQISDIMKTVISEFKSGEYDEVYLAYNEFVSIISQNRLIEKVLPIDPDSVINDENNENSEKEFIDYIFEPDVDSILTELLPLHINMQMWKAVLESNAAEQGARMTAMDNATENAKEMEDDLRLEYNRARQSAITTEISEIISGAQALEDA
jgi:F-type H+-transporting ATPase subunit gamma